MGKWAQVKEQVMKDINWWNVCASKFNGISLIMNEKWELPSQTVHSDVCLTGIGALTDSEFFHLQLPEWCRQQFTDINQLECFAILVAVRMWGSAWGRQNIVVVVMHDA